MHGSVTRNYILIIILLSRSASRLSAALQWPPKEVRLGRPARADRCRRRGSGRVGGVGDRGYLNDSRCPCPATTPPKSTTAPVMTCRERITPTATRGGPHIVCEGCAGRGRTGFSVEEVVAPAGSTTCPGTTVAASTASSTISGKAADSSSPPTRRRLCLETMHAQQRQDRTLICAPAPPRR
jgi:hypothetical protein